MKIKLGEQVGELTVIGYRITPRGSLKYNCICSCGREKEFDAPSFETRMRKSCGCYASVKKHGKTSSPLFSVWMGMKQRCDNPKSTGYKHYGGRGITYEDRWKEFKNFYDDMIEGYKRGLTLDRIDVNGNYSKDNCRWVDVKTQQNNRRNSIEIMFKGEKMSISELATICDMDYSTLFYRLKIWHERKTLDRNDIQ